MGAGPKRTSRRRRHRTISAALCLALAFTGLGLTVRSDRAAAAPVFYDGAPGASRISVIGDSVMAAIRWYGTWGPLRGYNYTVDVESCRRTVGSSCGGREGYRPDNTVQAMKRLRGRLGSVVIVGTGYDDAGWVFGQGIDAVMAEAAAQNIQAVVWVNMRTAGVNYVGPTYGSNRNTYLDNNRILRAKQAQYGERLRIADWATYSAARRDWVEWDGIHLTRAGATAMAAYIASQAAGAIRAFRLPGSVRLAATSLGANQVRLTWSSPKRSGVGPIIDFRYQYSTDGGNTWTTGIAGPATARSAIVSGLRNNTTYTFRIAARNPVGWSVTSNRVTVTTRLTGPATPTLTARAVGANEVVLNWTGSAYNGGSPILDYRYQYSTDGGNTWTTGVAGPPGARSTVVRGLRNNTTYTFRIAARNAVAWSVTSNRVTVTTRLSGPSTPTLSARVAGPNQVQLNWTGSQFTGGSPILDYRYQYSTDGGNTWTTGVAGPPSARSTVVTGLQNNTTYVFRIAARNALAWSVTSNRITVTTGVTGPSTPTLSGRVLGPTEVELSWTGSQLTGGSPILDYRYQYSTDGQVTWTTGIGGPPSARSTVVSGLEPGTTYVFRIAARNAVAWSVTSNRVTLTMPAAPAMQAAAPATLTPSPTSTPTSTAPTTSTSSPEVAELVAGVVWRDNGDGVREAHEEMVPDVEVRLRDAGGQVVTTTRTDRDGAYEFSASGEWVEFVLPDAARPTAHDVGPDDTIDSDAAGEVMVIAEQRVARVALGATFELAHVDLGLVDDATSVTTTAPPDAAPDSSTTAPSTAPAPVDVTTTSEPAPTTTTTQPAPPTSEPIASTTPVPTEPPMTPAPTEPTTPAPTDAPTTVSPATVG